MEPTPYAPATPGFSRRALAGLLLAAAGIPASLLADFSWESTVGIDRAWSPAHVATYLAVALAGALALRALTRRGGGVRLGKWHAPLGAWVVLWGAVAFAGAVVFDRWWQEGYGLAAGIWHPPQILKAVAFFAVLAGVWLAAAPRRATAFAAAGGLLLAMTAVCTLVAAYPNRQHAATFYQLACGTYPVVLTALAAAGTRRFSATAAALIYTGLMGAAVWLLPLIPAQPQVAPIYHALDHLMPPPFPLLLVLPALAVDALLRVCPGRAHAGRQAVECGLAFFLVFTLVQWPFAEFLLTPAADGWFFAGGGRHWPFFLKMDPRAQVVFWPAPGDEINLRSGLITAGLAVLAARAGLGIGAWLKRVQR